MQTSAISSRTSIATGKDAAERAATLLAASTRLALHVSTAWGFLTQIFYEEKKQEMKWIELIIRLIGFKLVRANCVVINRRDILVFEHPQTLSEEGFKELKEGLSAKFDCDIVVLQNGLRFTAVIKRG